MPEEGCFLCLHDCFTFSICCDKHFIMELFKLILFVATQINEKELSGTFYLLSFNHRYIKSIDMGYFPPAIKMQFDLRPEIHYARNQIFNGVANAKKNIMLLRVTTGRFTAK